MIVQPEQKVKTKKIVLIAILVVICGFCVFAYYNQGSFLNMKFLFTGQTNTNSKSILKVQYDQNQKPTFATYDNKVLSITKDGIKAITMENKVAWEIKYTLNNPNVETQDKYLLISDIGGKEISLYQQDKKIWSKTLDGTITNIKMNKNGYVLVFNQKEKSKQLIGYNNKGVEILKKDYGTESFLANADISKDNKKIVVLSIYTEKSRVASKIDFYEIKSGVDINSVPTSGAIKEDTLATDIKIFDNGNIVLIADNKIIALDGTGADKWIKDFTNLKVYKANISSGNYIVLETNGTITNKIFQNKSSQIQVINADGTVEGDGVKIASSTVDIDAYDNYFIVNDSTNLYSIAKGKLIWSCPIGKDIKYAKGFSGKSQILIVTKDYFEVLGII